MLKSFIYRIFENFIRTYIQCLERSSNCMTSAVPKGSQMDSVEVLFNGPESIIGKISGLSIVFFAEILQLINHLTGNIISVDRFVLIVPSDSLDDLLDDAIYTFDQTRQIYVYYDNDSDLKRDEDRLKGEYKKLRFCHKRNLPVLIQKLKVGAVDGAPGSGYQATVDGAVQSCEQRVLAKRSNPAAHRSTTPKRAASPLKHGFSVKNIEQVDKRYICSFCELLYRDPHQLECGHWICKPCIKIENSQTTCLTCFQPSENQCISQDRGFWQEMLPLPILCSFCEWTGTLQNYQEHIGDKHPEQGNSGIIRDAYTQQVDQHQLHESVHTTEAHEQTSSNTQSSSPSMQMTQNSNASNNLRQMLLAHFQEIIGILSNRANDLFSGQQRIDSDVQRLRASYQAIHENLLSIRASHEDNVSHTTGLKINQDLLAGEISSLKQDVHGLASTSHDGTYIWKITGVRDKIADARSERHRSIYSPVFYSSESGYKMCLRLYLNGDADTRDRYVSLFIVLMKNDYDAILTWPFSYPIKLRLINPSAPHDHERNIIHTIRPDIVSSCFQRPNFAMNEGYGIKEFVSIEQLEQNQSQFFEDDTMYIEVQINFSNENSPVSYSASGTPNDEEHVAPIATELRF